MSSIKLYCKLCDHQFTHDAPSETHHFMTNHLDLMFKFPEMEKLAALCQIHFLRKEEV